MSSRTSIVAAALLAAVVVPSAVGAASKAGPAPGTAQGRDGVATRDGTARFVAIAHQGSTLVQAISTSTGRVLRWGFVHGAWGVPLVTFNGQAEGLTHDEQTLLLGEAAYPTPGKGQTQFALVNARKIALRETITLQGSFSYDALSPDARTLYLIQYVNPNGPEYVVRAYDLRTRKLVPGAILDPREADEDMQGSPVARAATANGGWVFTLYATGTAPFVHALDTMHRKAVCIDLPWHAPDAIWQVKLRVEAGRLVLEQAKVGTLAAVDTKTWKVTVYRQPVKR